MIKFRKACLRFAGPIALTLAAFIPTTAQTARAQQQSSPNGKIAYQSTQGSDFYVNEIYTMDGDGKHQVRLTYNEFDDASPVFSPRGDLIAFLTDRGAGYDIYLIKPDGTGERPLRDAAHGGPLATDNLQWSPDGTRILYAVGGKMTVVQVLASDGSYSDAPVQNLSESAPDFAFDNNPAWSPDGSKVAFISRNCDFCIPDVFVVNADGSGRAQLTTNPEAEFGVTWTPDGRVAYGSWRVFPTNSYVINTDGTNEQPLTNAVSNTINPVWSPDGTRVVFGSDGPAAAPRGGLYVMNADGSGLKFLTDEANGGGKTFWSPDGTRIVAHLVNDVNWIDVISFPSDGSRRQVTNLTKTRKADEYAASWQRMPTP